MQAMDLRAWRRAGRGMTEPVRGVFRVADWYDPHPHWSSGRRFGLTGVITGDGVPATSADHVADWSGKWPGHEELPVVVDRANPSDFRILWGEVQPRDWGKEARERAGLQAVQPPSGAGDGPSGQPARGEPGGT